MKRHLAATLVALLPLTACNGTIQTEQISMGDMAPGLKVNGIITYPIALYKEITSATAYKDDNGGITGNCTPTYLVKIVTHQDYTRPMVVRYQPGIFDTSTFAATLNTEGALASVNSQTTPDQGKTIDTVANAAKTIATLAGVAAVAAAAEPNAQKKDGKEEKKKSCNVGDVSLERL